jgi:hypothetical protein
MAQVILTISFLFLFLSLSVTLAVTGHMGFAFVALFGAYVSFAASLAKMFLTDI